MITVSDTSLQLPAVSPERLKELLTAFISDQDVKETSKLNYTRILTSILNGY